MTWTELYAAWPRDEDGGLKGCSEVFDSGGDECRRLSALAVRKDMAQTTKCHWQVWDARMAGATWAKAGAAKIERPVQAERARQIAIKIFRVMRARAIKYGKPTA